jgi:hypothetical protein
LADFCLGPDGYYLRFWFRNVNERLSRKTSASSNGTGGIPLLRWFFFMGSADARFQTTNLRQHIVEMVPPTAFATPILGKVGRLS